MIVVVVGESEDVLPLLFAQNNEYRIYVKE